jgi:hypothetical protein
MESKSARVAALELAEELLVQILQATSKAAAALSDGNPEEIQKQVPNLTDDIVLQLTVRC